MNYFLRIAIVLVLISSLYGQESEQPQSIFPAADVVLDSLEKKFQRVEDYFVQIEISIKTPVLRMPRKKVKFWYKNPNMTKLEARGFAAIPKTGIASSPIEIFDNLTDINVIGAEFLDGRQTWILQGELNPDSLMYRNMGDIGGNLNLSTRLWVDKNDWILIKTETWVDTFKFLEVNSKYQAFPQEIHLPEETKLTFNFSKDMVEKVSDFNADENPFHKKAFSDSTKDNTGSITLKFSKYKVNQGIEDEYFEEEN